MHAVLACLALSAPTEIAPAVEPLAFTPVMTPTWTAPAVLGGDSKFSWTYGELNYIWNDIDALDDKLDGWQAKASFEIPLNIFLQASYGEITGDADLNETRLGAGWHFGVGDKIDLFGILSYAYEEVDGTGFDDTEDGVVGEVGARMFLGDRIEINGEAIWVDIDESDYGVGVGARFYVIPALSLGANANFVDSDETYILGARFQL